ncbi:hypothetical protein KI387_042889 [Taxus chinensis]|uniref:Uncharacterized protein n=1 Tax=Taxus chinensis TaxID=29808 RepID=A0AA38F4D4_TAXCH|nr:hypothetical protein KI387_043129 [Taxus chinensis]KAH9291924.1 hypothetical protein KI387_042889 [Taxus chinensis]
METSCKLKEGGTSVRIVPGPNGMSFDGAGQYKFMGAEGTHQAIARDASFSFFLGGNNTGQGINMPLKGISASMDAGGNINRPSSFANGVEKQNSYIARIPVGGRMTTTTMEDREISIFEAEKYFSAQEEKKLDGRSRESKTEMPKPIRETSIPNFTSNSTAKMHPGKKKVSLSSPQIFNRSFRPGTGSTGTGTTPTASSQASCNSQSALLSLRHGNSARKVAANNEKTPSGKWGFVCPCPCSNKRSVDIDQAPTKSRRAPSVTSTTLMDSPMSSIRYSYPALGKRVLTRSIEKNKSETASHITGFNGRGGSGTQILRTSVDNIPQTGHSKDREQLPSMLRKGAEEFTRITFEKEDGFSFSTLPVKSDIENPRPSLEVFGSPFHQQEITRKSASGMEHHRLSSDLHRRSLLQSLDRTRKSFTLDLNPEIRKFGEINNEEDKEESDSSSDLFEIESFTTHGTACYPLKMRRDSLDDIPSIQSGYPASSCCEALGFQSSFQFGEAVTPSAQSSCYEPSEASLDWSVTSADTIGNFSMDYEELKIMKRRASLQNSDLSRLRDVTLKGSSRRRSSGSSFLGCANAKAVSVGAPTIQYSQSTRYNS